LGIAEQAGDANPGSLGMTTSAFSALKGKKVLVTGHTGFKGSWLSLWLNKIGAQVYGFALEPPTRPSMFEACSIAVDVDHYVANINDLNAITRRIAEVKPDLVLHLAAQPIVRQSYTDPLETLSTNVMGTAHVLEAVRSLDAPCAVVVVSSDKCYDNREWIWGYREEDPLGGKDPYSMSKGGTELVVNSWRASFFADNEKVKLASARAGNVLGGGDWATDRIIPDCIRAFRESRPVELRNPKATRPWQHVLEPLGGYLMLASRLLGSDGAQFCSGWNFGPATTDVRTVEEVVSMIANKWPEDAKWSVSEGPHPKEASMLSLNCDKAISLLGWRPVWSLETLIDETVGWFDIYHKQPAEIKRESLRQIDRFEVAAVNAGYGAALFSQ
jgi:CDP-glucose 4,6-dehydratase